MFCCFLLITFTIGGSHPDFGWEKSHSRGLCGIWRPTLGHRVRCHSIQLHLEHPWSPGGVRCSSAPELRRDVSCPFLGDTGILKTACFSSCTPWHADPIGRCLWFYRHPIVSSFSGFIFGSLGSNCLFTWLWIPLDSNIFSQSSQL